MSQRVYITDVSPRDGLQNESGVIPTASKIELVRRLCLTGVDEIEVSSFVSPRWVPQLGDAADVFAGAAGHKPPGMIFSALAPNEQGAAALLGVNSLAQRRIIDKMSLFTAASEAFNRKNTNAGIDESLGRFGPALALAAKAGLWVRIYISCVIACPYEGDISPRQVLSVFRKIAGMVTHSDYWPSGSIGEGSTFAGVEIDLGDTIGAATPRTTEDLLNPLLREEGMLAELGSIGRGNGRMPLVLHFHDTFGHAAECVKRALGMGIRSFDGSAGGLGGCPYAKLQNGRRAPGNISTETLVRTVHAEGFRTGVDLDRLAQASDYARRLVADAPTAMGG
ncbi:MAG: hydroxymethylglutaryl-CoA lyase [Phycisphaerales bacterium]